MSQKDFVFQTAEEATKRFASVPVFFSPACIHKMIAQCADPDFNWETESEEWNQLASEVCPIMEKSREIQANLATLDEAPPVDMAIPAPETPVEASLDVGEAYDTTLEVCGDTSCGEMAILEAARATNLQNGWDKLSGRFDFGENFDQLVDKGPVSPADLASAMAYGSHMAKSGVFLTAKAMLRLQVLGLSNIVEQYAAEKGLGYSTVSGWLRMEQRIPADSPARKLLDPTAIAEIVNARYSKNEEENQRIREETLREACENRVDTSEARSLVLRVKGETSSTSERPSLREQLSELDRQVSKLRAALQSITEIPNSDSGGDWDEIEAARSIAAKALGTSGTELGSNTEMAGPDPAQ